MSHFEIKKQLVVEDFNNYGKSQLQEYNIDKNEDGIIQGSELNTLFEKVGGDNYSDSNAHDQIAGDVSTLLATEESNIQNTSRVNTPEGQAAINNFNNMTMKERAKVLSDARAAVEARGKNLIDNATNLVSDFSDINCLLESIKHSAIELESVYDSDGSEFSEKATTFLNTLNSHFSELTSLAKSLDGKVTDALIEFGGKDVFGNKGSYITQVANVIVSQVNALKQDFAATNAKLQNILYQINHTGGIEEKALLAQLRQELAAVIERMEKSKSNIMNGVGKIVELTSGDYMTLKPSAGINLIMESSYFFGDIGEKNIPSDLDMKNKVLEGIFMDVLMDAPQASSTQGIESSTNDSNQNATIYGLGGRVITGKPKQGQIYIQNGKKFKAK